MKHRTLIYASVATVFVFVVIIIYSFTRYKGRHLYSSSNVTFTPNEEYIFTTRWVKNILYAHGGNIKKTMIEKHPFYELNHEEQRRLCVAALQHLGLKNVDIEIEVNKFSIFDFNATQGEDHVGMRCSTVPFLLLCSTEGAEKSVRVVIEKNQFLDEHFEFHAEIIKSAVYREAVDFDSEKELRNDYISNNRQRWEMCVAAKSRISNVTLLSSYDWSDTVGVYEVIYPDGKVMKQVVAFPCNTSPKIYLRPTETVLKNKLTVLLEKN